MKALYFTKFGGPAVLQYGEVTTPPVTATTLLVKTTYIGLNYADIYRRHGAYHLEPHKPYIDGYEGLGEIAAMGEAVVGFKVGERLLFVDVPLANAELVAVPVSHAIRVPTTISDETAATIGLQGLTADFLAHDLAQGDQVLIHGISGGIGSLLSQILTADGVQVDGVASTPQKQALAIAAGARNVFLRQSDWATQYQSNYDTVFDGVGKTLPLSLKLTHPRGRIVFYGMAGGLPPKVDPVELMSTSKSLMTGDLWDYLMDAQARQKRADRLFQYVLRQQIVVKTPTIYSLQAGRAAHTALERGAVAGKILLKPSSGSAD